MTVRAQVSLEGNHPSPVGRERIRLLEALAREGSISGAARAVGLSYRAAWNAIEAMNNLFGRPVIDARTGGAQGGGAALTPEGVRVIETFHRLEAELARTLKTLEPDLAGTGISATTLMWGFLMRTSARNALRGTILTVRQDTVNAEVTLALNPDTTLTALITNDSVEHLGLFPGREAIALIKSSFVVLAPAGTLGPTSASNRLEGTISRREEGPITTEIIMDLGGTKALTAVITTGSAARLGLNVGDRACALIDAGHVILAVD